MISQVDEALCRLIAPHLPEGTVVRLDPPKPTWQTETRVSSVDLFLFARAFNHRVNETRAIGPENP